MLVSLLSARRLCGLVARAGLIGVALIGVALIGVAASTLLALPSAVSGQQLYPDVTSSTVSTASPDISLLEGGVIQTRPGYVPNGSTAPPMGPVLGPSPTIEPNEWSSVGLAMMLTVTPLMTVAALFWLSGKPLPPAKR